MKERQLVIIGGGSGGMAAAIKAYDEGIKDILILEKDGCLGGILNQCIHNGFGLTEFKEELSGPEYLSRFEDEVKKRGIEFKLHSLVTNITRDKVVTYTNKEEGVVEIKAQAIIMATGCYERNAGAIQIPGDRPKGVITAGTAQKYLNIHGYLVGKRVVILGSGDIGLIMARRMTLEGAKVLCVSEIMPYSNGLQRNISQCLNDFNIPLYLSHSVSKIVGKEKVEKVVISKVDDHFKFIPGTEMEFECDTLLLSIGLIPYISLLENINCPISSTKGAMVYDNMETFIDGIFACGNCLHVHDVVDFVSEEGRNAGHGAALYLKEKEATSSIDVKYDKLLSYVVPQKVRIPVKEDVTLKFRVRREIRNANVIVKSKDQVLSQTFKMVMIPSEMVMIKLNKDKLANLDDELYVEIVEKK
ncbi:MAG: FAD-dependent oxidoreductase [Bacilli bacterium]|nr:FAD-dependent oxidoreductase [Bacilli bacterium]